jgi:hypothetical protein
MAKNNFSYKGWKVSLKDGVLTVEKKGEERCYKLSKENEGIVRDKYFPEYFSVRTNKFVYSCKFEENNFFVGDKLSLKEEFVDSFACHVFGEDE